MLLKKSGKSCTQKVEVQKLTGRGKLEEINNESMSGVT